MMDKRLPVAVLAGGLATRMQPLTSTIPKALIDIAGEPFLIHQLRALRANGVERVVVCVGHLGTMIEDAITERRAQLGLDVTLSFDGPQLRGTAGALRNAQSLLGEAFFVLYGDSYVLCPFADVQAAFAASGRPALMTVFRNEGRWDTSNVRFDGRQILEYDKVHRSPSMKYIDYGLAIVSAAALSGVPADRPSDLATLYQELLADNQLAGFEVRERFYEIGSPAGLAETRAFLEQQTPARGRA